MNDRIRYWPSQGRKNAIMWWPGAPRIVSRIRWSWFRWHWSVTAHNQEGSWPEDKPGEEVLAWRSGKTLRHKTAQRAVRRLARVVDLEARAALKQPGFNTWIEDI